MNPNSNTFQSLPFDPKVQEVLVALGFVEPTEIQSQAIPTLMEKRKVDFHGQAQTGTGKTLAFGLPLIHRIDVNNKATQALVVAPTRELAVQICESIKPFAKVLGISFKAIYGGASMDEQVRALRQGVQLVVGTPGRVNDHLRRGIMKLDQLQTLVLDEADIMLDMGFKEEVDEIITFARKDREIWLFSATVKSGIRSIMQNHMKDTVSVSVSKQKVSTSAVKQYYCILPMRARLAALCRFMESAPEFYGFIFCQTKLLTGEVADALRKRGYQVGCLHGDMSQDQRNSVVKKFKAREYSVVVATDVAARGLDIQDLTHVINYSLPEDHESYVHRTGRTGRAGKEGIAITFLNRPDVRIVSMIARKFNIIVDPIEVPSRDDIIVKRMEQATTYLDKFLASTAGVQAHPSVAGLVQKFDEAQLHTLVTRFVQEKFVDSIAGEDESMFASHAGSSNSGSQRSSSSSSFEHARNPHEIMFAVGSDDGVDRDVVAQFLMDKAALTQEQVQKVRVLRRRTFIEVPSDIASKVLDAVRGASLGDRPIRAQFVEDQSRESRGGSSRDGGDFGSRNRSGHSSRRDAGRRDSGSRGDSRGGYRGDSSRDSGRSGDSNRSGDSSRGGRDFRRDSAPRRESSGRSDFAYRG